MNDQPIDDSMPVRPPALPPVNVVHELPPIRPELARWRWWIHVVVLASYVLGIGALSWWENRKQAEAMGGPGSTAQAGNQEKHSSSGPRGPALPEDSGQLLTVVAEQMGIFGLFWAVAWTASRVNRDQLMLRRRRAWWFPWVSGLGYSVAMRVILGVVVVALLTVGAIWMILSSDGGFTQAGFQHATTELSERLRPRVENLVDTQAITNSPLYLFLNATLISFVLAGFREELWRAGMLAGFRALFPRAYSSRMGQVAFVLIVATIFGLGHWPQGLGGVVLTTLLGIMLGLIMIFHRSIWEATCAHGFFNAASFVGMHFLYRLKDQYPELQRFLGAD